MTTTDPALAGTEAISYELRGSGVVATALSPGIVATEFLQVSGQRATRYQWLVQPPPPAGSRPPWPTAS